MRLIKSLAVMFVVTALTASSVRSQTVGTLPASTSPPGSEVQPLAQKKKVRPGESHCNADGVCVDNSPNSTGNAYVDPETGSSGSQTNVTTQSGFDGDITGTDSNDTVNLGSSNNCTVSGNGGTVSVGGGSSVTVVNTGGTGSTDMSVILSSGTTITVGAGSSVTINS